MKFSVGDKVVHPIQGAGTVVNIKEIDMGGRMVLYYEIEFNEGKMITNVPVDNADKIGLREIISSEEAKKVIEQFCVYEVKIDNNWNKRQRENIEKLRSGDIYVVLEVLKELMFRDHTKGLSTSERKTLAAAKQIVLSEIVMSGYIDMESLEEIMNDSVDMLI